MDDRMPAEVKAIPRCPHFGSCGGCQMQDFVYEEQIRRKRQRIAELLQQADVPLPAAFETHASRSYAYRNRIRLRIERSSTGIRLGYNVRGTTEFLSVTTCPIAAPILFQTAEALIELAITNRDAEHWLKSAVEVEVFANHDLSRVQLTLFCSPRAKVLPGSSVRLFEALRQRIPHLAGFGAAAFDDRTGPTGRILAESGSPGLIYRVGEIDYWISRGSFFQVNRFLVDTLVQLVCVNDGRPRQGALAWDLYSGVGLFTRVLAAHFAQITAVEANPIALGDLRNALRKFTVPYTLVQSTTLDFLQSAALQRERPDLVVLDPPRAGAGVEACERLNQIAPASIVYVSCDPSTLARDLAVLKLRYHLSALHMVDLFPQTSHVETVAILQRSS